MSKIRNKSITTTQSVQTTKIMKRKLSEDTISNREAKRAKTLQEPQYDFCCPELPSEVWFIILEALTIDCFDTLWHSGSRAWMQLAFLSSTCKQLQLECQNFKHIKSLVPKEQPNAYSFMNYFAELCSISCLKYAHERGVKMIHYSCESVAQSGSIECLKYMLSIGTPLGESTERNACQSGSFECVKFVYECQGNKWNSLQCSSAVFGEQLDVLKFVHETGGIWDNGVCTKIAKLGQLDMLTYAHEHGCPWDDDVCSAAALIGHVDMLKYAHEHGCPCNEGSIRAAARNGHIEAMKYLHEICGTWPIDTCLWAASGDHLECLIYAHEHGAEWNGRWIAEVAVAEDCKKVIEYLRGLGCPIPPKTGKPNLFGPVRL